MERMIDSDLIYNAVEFRYKFSTGNEHEWERALLDLKFVTKRLKLFHAITNDGFGIKTIGNVPDAGVENLV